MLGVFVILIAFLENIFSSEILESCLPTSTTRIVCSRKSLWQKKFVVETNQLFENGFQGLIYK